MTSSYAFESPVYRALIVLQTVSVTRFLMFLAKLPERCFWFRLRSEVTGERHSRASQLLREPRRTEPPPGNPTRRGEPGLRARLPGFARSWSHLLASV